MRWRPTDSDHTAEGFNWDLYVMAGNPTTTPEDLKGKKEGDEPFAQDDGSANVNAGNMFNSPDGLAFSESGLLFIQTDGNYKQQGAVRGHG